MKQSLLLYSKTYIWNTGSKSSISYFFAFGSKCYRERKFQVLHSLKQKYVGTKVLVTDPATPGYHLWRYLHKLDISVDIGAEWNETIDELKSAIQSIGAELQQNSINKGQCWVSLRDNEHVFTVQLVVELRTFSVINQRFVLLNSHAYYMSTVDNINIFWWCLPFRKFQKQALSLNTHSFMYYKHKCI